MITQMEYEPIERAVEYIDLETLAMSATENTLTALTRRIHSDWLTIETEHISLYPDLAKHTDFITDLVMGDDSNEAARIEAYKSMNLAWQIVDTLVGIQTEAPRLDTYCFRQDSDVVVRRHQLLDTAHSYLYDNEFLVAVFEAVRAELDPRGRFDEISDCMAGLVFQSAEGRLYDNWHAALMKQSKSDFDLWEADF